MAPNGGVASARVTAAPRRVRATFMRNGPFPIQRAAQRAARPHLHWSNYMYEPNNEGVPHSKSS